MKALKSFWFKKGGGSWIYEYKEGGTLWKQANTIILRNGWLGKLAKPIFHRIFNKHLEQSMKRAKKIIEAL